MLAAQRVQISGLKTLTKAEVTAKAAVPLGVPLARQDLPAIASRIATFPQAEYVVVERTWPDAVTITVTERTPVFAVRYANLYVLVDKVGIPYLTVSKRPGNLPLAAASKDDRASLAEIAVVSRELPKKLRDQVVTIRAESPYALVLVLDSGVEIAWGTSEQSALKAEVALALLKQDPKAIDVSSPHNPTSPDPLGGRTRFGDVSALSAGSRNPSMTESAASRSPRSHRIRRLTENAVGGAGSWRGVGSWAGAGRWAGGGGGPDSPRGGSHGASPSRDLSPAVR